MVNTRSRRARSLHGAFANIAGDAENLPPELNGVSKRRASSGGAPACKRLRTAAKPAEAAQLSAPLEPKEPPQREAPRAFSPRITACQLASVAESAQQTATGALLACPSSATPDAEPAAIAGACLNCVCSCHGFLKSAIKVHF